MWATRVISSAYFKRVIVSVLQLILANLVFCLNSLSSSSTPDPGNSLSKVSSSTAVDSSTKHLLQKKHHTNSSLLGKPDTSPYGPGPHSPSTLPQSYATAAGASSRESQLDNLMMQHLELEKKKEVFLDHLKQKYPHHAAIMMRNQDHIREQRFMELEADVVYHELIYIKEADFNLAKTRDHQNVIGHCAIINNPRQHGAIFCVLAFFPADDIKILTEQIRK
ncbi:uncharacterized protein AKAME5_001854000 [Lates japonicus]|uniref:Uncharacterized protein n=1 Tax=Lates japonicus TaxID=270547 RepID=A0AAD3N7J3_LATJO|nr:uncharacterized protein AKAME5_001854000 [Lates japonicus]